MLLLPLLLEATLLRLASGFHRPFYNGFYYNHLMNDKGNGQEEGISGIGRGGGRCKGLKSPLYLWDVAGTHLLGGMWTPEEQAGVLQGCSVNAHGMLREKRWLEGGSRVSAGRFGDTAQPWTLTHSSHLPSLSPVDYFNGAKLVVETSKDPVYSSNGANVTLPCHYHYEPDMEAKPKIRIKWSKLRDDYTKEQDVLVAIGKTYMAFGDFQGRAHLRQVSRREASLVISDVRLQDDGKYRCEVIDGLEDESDVVDLQLQGGDRLNPCAKPVSLAFPWHPFLGADHKAGALGSPIVGRKGLGCSV